MNFIGSSETTKYQGKQDGVKKKYSKNWSSKGNGFIVKISYFLSYFWSMILLTQWIVLLLRDISVSSHELNN